MGDAAYYYFPVFAAYSSAKKFKTSPVLALLIAVVMIYPDMLAIVEDGKPFSVFGIPMQLGQLHQAVLPVILITWPSPMLSASLRRSRLICCAF
ncbi:MAG: hypothetical protein ACLRM9_00180 [Collinsella aerofaciens]